MNKILAYIFMNILCMTALNAASLKIPFFDEIKSLNPHQSVRKDLNKVIDQVFENLVAIEESGHIGPELATDWEISVQHKTLTFNLKKGVLFSDGTELDATIVKASLLNSKKENNHIGLQISSIEVLGKYKLRLRTKDKNFSLLLRKLATQEGAVTLIKNNQYLGTGPFYVESHQPEKITLKRKESRANYFEKIDFNLMKRSDLMAEFKKGNVDEIYTNNYPDGVNALPENIIQYAYPGTFIMVLNQKVPLEDRRRIALHLNKENLLEGIRLEGDKASSLIPKGMLGHNSALKSEQSIKDHQKKIKTLRIGLVKSSVNENAEEVFKREFKRLGYHLEVEYDGFISLLKKFREGKIDLTFKIDSVHFFDPVTIFNSYLGKSNNNIHSFDDSYFNELYTKAESEVIRSKKRELIKKLEEKVIEQALYIPLAYPRRYKVYSNKVNAEKLKDQAFMSWSFSYSDFLRSSIQQ